MIDTKNVNICIKCNELYCCVEPFQAFVFEFEKKRIMNYLKENKYHLKENSIFNEHLTENNEQFYTIQKQVNGRCLFLQKNGNCFIHDVKPFDCKLYPFTFDYEGDLKGFILYIGNCKAVQNMKENDKLQDFIESNKEILFHNAQFCKEHELMAYTESLHVKNLKRIK